MIRTHVTGDFFDDIKLIKIIQPIVNGAPAQLTIICNLLDNITATNREHVDNRLNELNKQRQQLESRLEELERLNMTQAEIKVLVSEAMQFISGLEFTLTQGLPQEKLVALRQCIEKITINKPAGEIKLTIHLIPTGNLQAIQEIKVLH